MKEEIATSDASLVNGFAWHVYPDPATPGTLAGDSPFTTGDPRGPGRPPLEPPPGVSALWTVHGKVPALVNQVEGRAYLVLTGAPEPPQGRFRLVRRTRPARRPVRARPTRGAHGPPHPRGQHRRDVVGAAPGMRVPDRSGLIGPSGNRPDAATPRGEP